ncbi:hypothetical protein [Spongiactinospora sp. TRM90649]|uniref:hypothetical protein n=1 Tax=Spongiactinospora sp. TRM90649 TaxID=3031114 RepID=UPI0023F70FCA|nr:hypothetical protein [Spongiactinospora sp. TRM90649]MDF5754078.1 hypothetical protein [Spongiactinospora sp. TRM90649]
MAGEVAGEVEGVGAVWAVAATATPPASTATTPDASRCRRSPDRRRASLITAVTARSGSSTRAPSRAVSSGVAQPAPPAAPPERPTRQ